MRLLQDNRCEKQGLNVEGVIGFCDSRDNGDDWRDGWM